MVCTFFGHRDTPSDIAPRLREILMELIVKRNICVFYVGFCGAFDRLVIRTLSELKTTFPHISVTVVLAYLPSAPLALPESVETLFPAEAATAPRRYAIDRVNRWLVNHADLFVTYITRPQGGAATYARLAARRGKEIIELGKQSENV